VEALEKELEEAKSSNDSEKQLAIDQRTTELQQKHEKGSAHKA
jgi:hypothetical protein